MEDFQQGALFDCYPVCWRHEVGTLPLHYHQQNGELVMGFSLCPAPANEFAVWPDAILTGEVSVRAQARIAGNGAVFVMAHGSPYGNPGWGGYRGFLRTGGELELRRGSPEPYGARTLATGWIADFESDRAYFLQLDRRGGRIEFRVWKEGEATPEAPQLGVEDEEYQGGIAGIGFEPDDRAAQGVFQRVEISKQPLQDQDSHPETQFRRGDANADGEASLADAIFSLNYQFLGGARPGCLKTLDADANGALELADPIYLLRHLFLGGAPPPEPFRHCGLESSGVRDSGLGCNSHPACD